MSFIGQIPLADQTVLFNTAISTTGALTGINTTGFAALTIQIANANASALWSGIITIEGSNDNINWFPLLLTKINELSPRTQIDSVGLYQVKADTLYIRANPQQVVNSCSVVVTGATTLSTQASDKLALAMDLENDMPMFVSLQPGQSGVKQDASGAFILSDAPTAITTVQLATGGQTIIDTTGYQTIHLTTNSTFAATGGVQFGNDGITFSQGPMQTAAGLLSTTLVGTTTYIIPVTGRYARIIATTAGQFTYYLRNAAAQFTGQNLIGINGAAVSATTAQLGMNVVQVGGTATVTGGLAGTLGVGGSVGAGVAPTSNPVIAGGIDPAGLTRRLAADALGSLFVGSRVVPSSTAALGTATQAPLPVVTSGFNNQVALSSQDTTTVEGQLQIEVLNLILQEMKIMNQQLYELPRIQAGYFNGYQTATPAPQPQLGDEPTAMRNDASLFINQQ